MDRVGLVEHLQRGDRGEDRGHDHRRPDHRQLDLQRDLPLVRPVEPRRLVRLLRQRAQRGVEHHHVEAGAAPHADVGDGQEHDLLPEE